MIRLEGAGLRRGERWIFRGLDLALAAGRTLAVLGPNGRGKTTLIRAATGLLALDEGRRQAPAVIGYLAQTIGEPAPYRVLDMVLMGRAHSLGLFGSPTRADHAAAEAALERVGATALARQGFDRLSGGERQTVLMARALATGSPVLVLDEPMSALDLANQARLLRLLCDLRAEGRYAILFSTHAPEHALHAADDALLMVAGRPPVSGPVGETLSEAHLSALYGLPIRRTQVTGADGRTVEAVIPLYGAAG